MNKVLTKGDTGFLGNQLFKQIDKNKNDIKKSIKWILNQKSI